MTSVAREALDEHIAAVAVADIDRVASGYAPCATLVTPEGSARGREEIAAWFSARTDFFARLELRRERIELAPGTARLDWWGKLDERTLEGRDEFDVDEQGLLTEQRVVRVGRCARGASHLRVELDPPLLRLVLDRDEKRNAVSQPMLRALTRALAEAAGDDRVRAVVLAGDGRDFCAGEDVRGFEFPDAETAERFLDGPMGFFTAVEEIAKPFVVAVHGNALGFGSEVLLVADTVVASRAARFGFAEIDHGAVPSVLVTRGLDVSFRRRALRYALTGERFGIADAVQARMVHVVADDPGAVADQLARQQAEWSPAAVRTIKALLGKGAADDHDHARGFMPRVLTSVEPAI